MLRAFIGLAVISGLWLWGSADAAGDETIFRGVVIGIALSLFPLVYAWKFIRAPAEIDIQKNAALITSSIALTHKIITKKKILTLSVFLEQGYELSVERISEDEFLDWKDRVSKWGMLGVTFLASNFTHQDAVSFKNVRYTLRENFIFKANEEHNRELQQLTARLETLRNIASRHETEWSPISTEERSQIISVLTIIKAQAIAANSDQDLKEENG